MPLRNTQRNGIRNLQIPGAGGAPAPQMPVGPQGSPAAPAPQMPVGPQGSPAAPPSGMPGGGMRSMRRPPPLPGPASGGTPGGALPQASTAAPQQPQQGQQPQQKPPEKKYTLAEIEEMKAFLQKLGIQ